jgi:hypothetical protein
MLALLFEIAIKLNIIKWNWYAIKNKTTQPILVYYLNCTISHAEKPTFCYKCSESFNFVTFVKCTYGGFSLQPSIGNCRVIPLKADAWYLLRENNFAFYCFIYFDIEFFRI